MFLYTNPQPAAQLTVLNNKAPQSPERTHHYSLGGLNITPFKVIFTRKAREYLFTMHCQQMSITEILRAYRKGAIS